MSGFAMEEKECHVKIETNQMKIHSSMDVGIQC